MTYSFAGNPSLEWVSVNPFDRVVLPIQPRWVSVEVRLVQAYGEIVWLDNVVLTGKCVPEPSSLLALLSGCGLIPSGLWLRRKQARQ